MAKRRKQKKSIGAVVAIAGACLVGLGIASFVYAKSLGTTIHPGVFVGGVSLGGRTAPVAQQQIEALISRYSADGIALTVRGATVRPKPYEVGLSFDTAATVRAAYLVGRNNAIEETFGMPAFGRVITVPLVVSLDQQQFHQYLTALNNWFEAPVQQPRFGYNGGQPTVVAGLSGVGVAVKDFSTQLLTNAASLTPTKLSLDLEKQEPIATPEQMETLLPRVAALTEHSINLDGTATRVTLTPDMLTNLLIPIKTDGKLSLGIDESRLSEDLAAADQKIRRDPKPTFGFIAEHDGVYAYKNSEGIAVDVTATKQNLEQALFDTGDTSVAIATKTLEPPIEYEDVTAPIADGKVISVDVTKQSLFAFDSGKLVFWTRVSTGINDWTPTGQWKIYAKTPIQVMSGPGYYLPGVKWVMPYNGDYTLHTAYWHHDFGIPKSHGCTNMYEEDAKWLFDWSEVGTPVVIYKS